MENTPIRSLDLKSLEGKWYSLYSIPTLMDKNWEQTTETYTLTDDNYFDVYTTYHKHGKPEEQSITSKLFFNEEHPDGAMKAQFIWPFKIGYWVIELASDYSYIVVGHPDEKYLFIMSRTPDLDPAIITQLIELCREKGYQVEELKSQQHPGQLPLSGFQDA